MYNEIMLVRVPLAVATPSKNAGLVGTPRTDEIPAPQSTHLVLRGISALTPVSTHS